MKSTRGYDINAKEVVGLLNSDVLPDELNNFMRVFLHLENDYRRVLSTLHDSGEIEGRDAEISAGDDFDQSYARIFVRTQSAFIEGVLQTFKQTIHEVSAGLGTEFSELQKMAIGNERLRISHQGEIRKSTEYLSTKKEFRFVIRLLNSILDETVSIEYGGQGWENFVDTIELRNRVTHPKRHEELTIKPEELENAYSAGMWFRQKMHEALTAYTRHYDKRRRDA